MNISFGNEHTGMLHLDDGTAVEVRRFIEQDDDTLIVLGRPDDPDERDGDDLYREMDVDVAVVTGIHID
jgi:hypothetical protein